MKKDFAWVARIGADPNDEDDIRLRKSLLVVCAFLFAVAGTAWGLTYILFGEPLAGTIPLSYAAISLLSILHFWLTRRYHFFRFSQLILILLLPFFLMLTLGGFVSGSAVILWALICPLGALLFDEPSHAPRWFLAFASLVILSGFLQPYMGFANNMSSGMVIFFFAVNLIGVGSIVFLMFFYFVGQKDMFQEKSEGLLLNILPKEIVDILKNEPRTIADHFEGASVLFADIVNFTPLSEKMTPRELVKLLNEVFSYFDLLVEKYGLEKIKTIGDCYMVASGVPRPRPDHAQVPPDNMQTKRYAITCLTVASKTHSSHSTLIWPRVTPSRGVFLLTTWLSGEGLAPSIVVGFFMCKQKTTTNESRHCSYLANIACRYTHNNNGNYVGIFPT
jgi:guanylate cyclase